MQDFQIKITETRIVDLTVKAQTKAEAKILAVAASNECAFGETIEAVTVEDIYVDAFKIEFFEHEGDQDDVDPEVIKGIAETMHSQGE